MSNTLVQLTYHLIFQLKLYITMNVEENRVDLTPAIYVILMVVVFSLALNY
jgi:hypothetical protein